MTDTNSNGDGVFSTSFERLPAIYNSPLNTYLNSDSCYTSLSLNNNKSIGVASSASIIVLDARNKSEQTNFRIFIPTSAAYTMSNESPKILCNYKNILKDHTNLVDSKINGSSIMSPPVFTINTANPFTV